MTYRRLPNSWESPAEVVRAPRRLRGALRSREKTTGDSRDAGTRPLSRKYYGDEMELVETLRKRRANGADVAAELAALGAVNVGRRGSWRQIGVDEAMCLAWPPPDRLHRDLRHSGSDLGKEEPTVLASETPPLKPCLGGCGTWIQPTHGKCARCAGEAVEEWKARRATRRR